MKQDLFFFTAETDLAYLAGIIDGEGSISIFGSYGVGNKKRYHRYRLILNVYNNDENLLLWIRLHFGGRVRKVMRKRQHWNNSFIWETGWQHARTILENCLPYLKVKKLRAELFIAMAKTMKRNGKTSPNVLTFRNGIVEQMKVLNQRGGGHAMVTK